MLRVLQKQFYPEILSDSLERTDEDTFEVLCVGMSRCGTMSTIVALRQLLNGPAFHCGIDLYGTQEQEHVDYWLKALEGSMTNEDWRKFLRGYKCASDVPILYCFKEILEAFPDCKIVFMDRDPKEWVKSWMMTIDSLLPINIPPVKWMTEIGAPRNRFKVREATAQHKVPGMSLGLMDAWLGGETTAVQYFNEWKQVILDNVPADRLLVFNVKEGWEPLCKFLGKPVPENPFPHINEAAALRKFIRAIVGLSWITFIGGTALTAVAFNWLWKWSTE